MKNSSIRIIFFLSFIFALLTVKGQQGGQVQLISEPSDRAYERVHLNDLKPIPYPYLREGDVFWEKRVWRSVDFREKMNHPLYFPETPQGKWKSLMQVLWDALLAGEITAYDPVNTDNFEEMSPIPSSQLESQLSTTETTREEDPATGQFQDVTFEVPFDPQEIVLLWIKEDWIFDKQRSEMQIRIVGICPVKENIDPVTQVFRGYDPLFWIYYPEVRPVLARNEVFNPLNSARRLSFDQLFLQRRFSSFIIKEDNVFDRRIDDYATGIDALLEAERIKNEIRDFEQELWSY
jgi:gliding motility associated protien GldN